MMTDWFRSWHGAPTDAKWLAVARRANVAPLLVSAVAWALFDHASQAQERGCVVGFDAESYAVWAGVDENDVLAVLQAMGEKRVIVDGWLAAWERRQPKRNDDSTMRVRAFRERSPDMKRNVTHGNAEKRAVTAQIQSREEKSREEQQQAAANARTREKPPPSLYADILNGSLPKLESMFHSIDELFTPAWLAKELADAAAVIGPLSREQLGRGLDIAVKQIERQMAAKTVRNPRPFAHKLIVDYLTEQRDEHHAA